MFPTFSRQSLQYFFLNPRPSRSFAIVAPVSGVVRQGLEQLALGGCLGWQVAARVRSVRTALQEMNGLGAHFEALAPAALGRDPFPHLEPALDEHRAPLL